MTFLTSQIASRKRGGTFFTMLIFVMLLVSTALMYYYFQRTRYLEREVAALRSGDPAAMDNQSGFFGLLPWGDNSADNVDTATQSVAQKPPTPTAEPETIATPTPEPGTELSQPALAPLEPDTSASLDMTQQEPPVDTLTPEQEREFNSDNSRENNASKGEPANEQQSGDDQGSQNNNDEQAPAEESKPIESMYDQPAPRVRVRSPRRD